MGTGKSAIAGLVALAGLSVPLVPAISFAQMAAPSAASTQGTLSLSVADKEALIKKLNECKKHDKIARAGWSQEPLTQAGYDKKIDEIKALIAKLQKGEDFPMSDVDKACASPGTAPY